MIENLGGSMFFEKRARRAGKSLREARSPVMPKITKIVGCMARGFVAAGPAVWSELSISELFSPFRPPGVDIPGDENAGQDNDREKDPDN